MKLKILFLVILKYCLFTFHSHALCVDNVVFVHGNAVGIDMWENTYNKLKSHGYSDDQMFAPEWGTKNPFVNDHAGSEETPVRKDIEHAIKTSCTGKIDVIAYSMGVTLAAKQIIKLGVQNKVDAFVAIAGVYRGLNSCGVYPYHAPSALCGADGFSISSPFLKWLYGKKFAKRVYSIISWRDEIICATGTCMVNGTHSSKIKGEIKSFEYDVKKYTYGHKGLPGYTSAKQYELIK